MAKAFPTCTADVGCLLGMGPQVLSKLRTGNERLPTFSTPEWLFSRVNSLVHIPAGQMAEAFSTLAAGMGFFPRVGSFVPIEV